MREGFHNNYRMMMRYSGQHNLFLLTIGFIYLDYCLDDRIKKELERCIAMKNTLDKIEEDINLKQKIAKQANLPL